MPLEIYDLKRIDLYMEHFIPKERVRSFREELVNDIYVQKELFDLIVKGKSNRLQMILNWALYDDEIKEFLKCFLLLYLKPKSILYYSCNELKCIEKSLEWRPFEEIKELKKSFAVSSLCIVNRFEFSLLNGDFKMINVYLSWIFTSEIEFIESKRMVVEQICRRMSYSSIITGVHQINIS